MGAEWRKCLTGPDAASALLNHLPRLACTGWDAPPKVLALGRGELSVPDTTGKLLHSPPHRFPGIGN